MYGLSRFDEFQRWLGIGRNILSRRLAQLVDQGVLEKHRYQEKPPRYEYRLTPKGYDAARLLLAMMPFGEHWQFAPGEEPIHVYHRGTGNRVRPLIVDGETGEELDVRELYAGPGPGFPKNNEIRRERFPEYYRRRPG